MAGVGWLSEYSEAALRSALGVACAGLEQLPIELTGTNDLNRPMWATGSATIDGRFLAKFAFSEPTAVRVWHEARVLKLLGEQPAFDVPDVVAASPDPACVATRIVEVGVPLSYELVLASTPERVGALGAELARFLANLHAPQILALVRERVDEPLRIPEPTRRNFVCSWSPTSRQVASLSPSTTSVPFPASDPVSTSSRQRSTSTWC